MVEVFHFRVLHSCIYDYPPTCKKLLERKKKEHNSLKYGLLTTHKTALEKNIYKIILTVSSPVATDSITNFAINLGMRLNAKPEIYLLQQLLHGLELQNLRNTQMQTSRTHFILNRAATHKDNVSLFFLLPSNS